jgi:hypothetical protein
VTGYSVLFFLFWIITSQEVFSVFRMHVYLYYRKFFRHGKTLFCYPAKMANVMSRHVLSIWYISSFAFGCSALFCQQSRADEQFFHCKFYNIVLVVRKKSL